MNYELFTTKHWMILPSFVHGILPTLMHNANNHVALGTVEKKRPMLALSGGDFIREVQVTEDGAAVPRYYDGENLLAKMSVPFVNVMPVDGPITRNGDACTYGSKDIRDWMMEAADNRYCRAHVIVINTPGGSAWAKNDFKQAIDYAHERGQRVYALIDGLCASAGMYLASFCDEVYVVNLKDQLGCVGVMASFFTLGDGEKVYTNETYHEYYATKSINKNKEIRDIANDNDATLLIAELDKLENEFRTDMQASFTNAADEHLDGKVFYADEVMGILCDGQMLLGELIGRAFAVADGSEHPIERTASRNVGRPTDVPTENRRHNVSPTNSTNMTEKYQNIAQVLGVEELNVTEEGTFLNAPLLDTLAEKLTEMQTKASEVAGLQAKIDELTKQLGTTEQPAEGVAPSNAPEGEAQPATEQPAEEAPAAEAPASDENPATEGPATEEAPAQEQPAEEQPANEEAAGQAEALATAEAMIAERDKEIADLKESLATLEGVAKERDKAMAAIDDAQANVAEAQKDFNEAQAIIAERDKTIAEHVATIAAKDAALTEKDASIEALKKKVADLQAEVKELSEKPAPMTSGDAGVPAGNGTGEAPKVNPHQRIKAGMTYKEIRAKVKSEK